MMPQLWMTKETNQMSTKTNTGGNNGANQGAGWPSTKQGQSSGGGRDNNPPGGKK